MSDEPHTPDGFEVSERDERPGEPLYPGRKVSHGTRLRVWFETYADGHGTYVVTGDLLVIESDAEGDHIALPATVDPAEAEELYRIDGDLQTITSAAIVRAPRYDTETGVLTMDRQVEYRGDYRNELVEVRKLGRGHFWNADHQGEL